MKNEIILFENQNVTLEVNMKDETVWLLLEQLATLFDRNRTVIKRHINNILKEKELNENEVCAKFAHTTKHGALENQTQTREKEELDDSTIAKFATVQKESNRTVTRNIDYYNLDMNISVGYRVKSKNGIIFRKWANRI